MAGPTGGAPEQGRAQELLGQNAQNMIGPLLDMADSGAIKLNGKAWEEFIKAQKPSSNIEDRRKEKD